MKKLITIYLLLCLVPKIEAKDKNYISYPNGIATVCFNGGNCYVISRLMVNGNWQNACCQDLPPSDSCNDDCGALTLPNEPQSFENFPAFSDQNPTITLDGGNKAWIFKNGKFLENKISLDSEEAVFLNEIPNFDFINNSEVLQFVSIKINKNTFAVINRIAVNHRKRGTKELAFFSDFDEHIKNRYALNIVPNPVSKGNQIQVYTESGKKVESAKLINTGGGIISNLEITNNSKKGCKIFIGSNLQSGVYQIIVQLEKGIILKEKLIIK